jgi:AraC family transcriptional regulator, regulatory protein of adaptative response / methylated-DNA-[protein]-cysteine methyltransferase
MELIPSVLSSTSTDDYDRIAEAIAFLRDRYPEQPDLATIAQHVHLSEYHFQRLFTRWAGISPKRFLQYLTVEYAKSQIRRSQNLMDLSLRAGLSGPGRLHDLFVTLEAVSPGEYKAGGAGLEIRYGFQATPFGRSLMGTTTRGLCYLQFVEVENETNAVQALHAEWPQARFIQDLDSTGTIAQRLFEPTTPASSLTVLVKGTNFQIQVWRALLAIPLGSLTTYRAIAQAIDRPTASRAVGTAIGRNSIAYLIPCHRVIRESGELGGYRWGTTRKFAMVGWEASRHAPTGEDS